MNSIERNQKVLLKEFSKMYKGSQGRTRPKLWEKNKITNFLKIYCF